MRLTSFRPIARRFRIPLLAMWSPALGRAAVCLVLAASCLGVLACGNPTVDATVDATANAAAVQNESNAEAADHGAMDHGPVEHAHEDEASAFESAAVRFAEESFGDNDGDYGLTFAPDGRSVLFTRAIPTASSEAIYFSRLVDGEWSTPEAAPFSGRFHDKEPYASPDGRRVYFASRRPVRGGSPRSDFDIWYVERSGEGWGDPVHLDAVSSPYNDDYPAVASDGTLVFARGDAEDNVDLWVAAGSTGGLDEPRRLDRPIKSVYAEADPWIAPDGQTIIFSSPRISAGSQGQGDLYVIRRQGDGWTAPASLGLHVNSIAHEYGPALSPDGGTFYFSRGFGGHVWMVPASMLEQLVTTAAR